MLKVAEPAQVSVPSVEVAVSEMVYPLPAGNGPSCAEIVLLWPTSMLPVCENPPGPVMEYETVAMVAPPACRANWTVPASLLALPADWPPEKHPAVNSPPASSVTIGKTNRVRRFCTWCLLSWRSTGGSIAMELAANEARQTNRRDGLPMRIANRGPDHRLKELRDFPVRLGHRPRRRSAGLSCFRIPSPDFEGGDRRPG